MKANFKTWILGAWIVFLWVFGTLIFNEYMANHTYYYDMLKNTNNLYIILATFISAAIPVSYLLYRKNASIKGFARTTWIGLVLYGILYASIRDNILGTGAIMRVINSLIIFWLSLFMIVGLYSVGARLYKRLYKDHNLHRKSLLLSFGLGFCIFVVLNYLLILIHIYYPLINRIQMIWLGVIIRKSKDILSHTKGFLNEQISSFFVTKKYTSFQRITAVLVLISIAYYFIGFKLAYIPYPTAWDANHLYMLVPNAISGGYGRIWNTNQSTYYLPVYLSFVSFFFSIIKWLGNWFWISPDTMGIQMNFLTAIFTFFTTLGIINKALHLMQSKDTNDKNISYAMWRFIKILRLTSGMWAFLVFVDNKSDFWVMYLSCLGLFTWLWFIDYLIKKYNQNSEDDISKREGYVDLYLSWFFFAIATASKVTALFDAMNFVLLIVGFILWWVVLCGLWLIIMGILAYLWLNGVNNFISKSFANLAWFGWWALVTLLWLAKWQHKKSYSYRPRFVSIFKQVLIWWVIFVITLVVLKLPIWLFRVFHEQTDPSALPKEMIFWSTRSKPETLLWKNKKPILLASTNMVQLLATNTLDNSDNPTDLGTGSATITWSSNSDLSIEVDNWNKDIAYEQCSLSAVWASSPEQLYDNLSSAGSDGYNEDVGRYVGFGQKAFQNPRRWFIIPADKCLSLNKSAVAFCKNQTLINSLSKSNAQSLLSKLTPWSEWYTLVNKIVTGFDSEDKLPTYVSDSQKLLTDYRRDKVIQKNGSTVSIPFKVLVPFNVTFNRSLQNLSSYYTDIGVIWLIIQFFIIVGVIYGLRSWNRLVRVVNLVALIGRLFWIAIGGGIVWYAIGLITWSIMWFVLFVHDLYIPDKGDEHHETNHLLFKLFVWLFLILWLIQLSLNFVRISSQGSSWPFLQYRYSNGQELQIDENLQQKVSVKFPYKRRDIINLQFPHYNKTITAINAQTGKEQNIIAGTYLQYRINDQSKAYSDGLLTNLRERFSDRDVCKSYLRLKDKNFKYLVIDPNIASIVMGGGNSSLMERFFAKLDPTGGKVVVDWTMTMLAKLTQEGYLKLYNTNNLGAKYGFELSSEYIKSKFGSSMSDEEVVVLRAKLATMRFWWNQQQMIQVLSQIFTERVADGKAVSDIADVYGKVIDEPKLTQLVDSAIKWWFEAIAPEIKNLTQDERFVLLNYLNVRTSYNRQPAQFGSVASNIITQSLGGGSQLIVFEVK